MSRFRNWINHNLDKNQKRRTTLVLIDLACFAAVDLFFFLIALRVDGGVPVEKVDVFLWNSLAQLIAVFAARAILGVYRNVWRYANTKAYYGLVLADGLGSIAALIAMRLLNFAFTGIYYGVWQAVTVGSLVALLTLLSRFVYALLYMKASRGYTEKLRVPVAIAGAGRLGAHLAADLQNNPNSKYNPMFFVDVDGTKINNRVGDLRVYDPETAESLIRSLGIQEVIISITRKDSELLSRLYHHYRELGCTVRVYDSLVGEGGEQKGKLRPFSIEDLLFRKPVSVNDQAVESFYSGKTVLVTGGGGSIGSELCRQIAACKPGKLVIFDIYENNAYDIQQELMRRFGNTLNLAVEIGSVRDVQRLDELFRTHRPQVVFHAAAHKHVPLMENSSAEAIKNNCMGTYHTANAAEKYGVEKFILISTDKAVNPTNVMGASKRVCEMIVQCRGDSATSFAAVRFGNVLGSNGSVIPLFKRQIEEGGPVTITDKRIIRYFMTISEASQLVIHAGAMAQKGELFVLDMGKPVRIYDLAVNMIQLSGLEPDVDIQIQEVGLRPGEKLFEELLMSNEDLGKTENSLIFIEHDAPYTREQVEQKLQLLQQAVRGECTVHEAIARVVPTYHTPEEVNQAAESSKEMQLAGSC